MSKYIASSATSEKAMKERILARCEVLRAIRDGKDYSKEDKVLRPLTFGGLIALTYENEESTTIVDAEITAIGEQYLFYYTAKYK